MIADATFLDDRLRDQRRNERGAASAFMAAPRNEPIRTTIISAGELAAMFAESTRTWEWLRKWKSYPLHPGIAQAAADVDRTLMAAGRRLGKNDNSTADFAAYNREPNISHDPGFDAIPRIRRVRYHR